MYKIYIYIYISIYIHVLYAGLYNICTITVPYTPYQVPTCTACMVYPEQIRGETHASLVTVPRALQRVPRGLQGRLGLLELVEHRLLHMLGPGQKWDAAEGRDLVFFLFPCNSS